MYRIRQRSNVAKKCADVDGENDRDLAVRFVGEYQPGSPRGLAWPASVTHHVAIDEKESGDEAQRLAPNEPNLRDARESQYGRSALTRFQTRTSSGIVLRWS